MIGIDLLAEGAHSRQTVQVSTQASCMLCQGETGTTMKEAQWLAVACRNRHPHHDALTGRIDQLDIKRLAQAFHAGTDIPIYLVYLSYVSR